MKLFKSAVIILPLFLSILGVLLTLTSINNFEIIIAVFSLVVTTLTIAGYKILKLSNSYFTKDEFSKMSNIAIGLSTLILFIGIFRQM